MNKASILGFMPLILLMLPYGSSSGSSGTYFEKGDETTVVIGEDSTFQTAYDISQNENNKAAVIWAEQNLEKDLWDLIQSSESILLYDASMQDIIASLEFSRYGVSDFLKNSLNGTYILLGRSTQDGNIASISFWQDGRVIKDLGTSKFSNRWSLVGEIQFVNGLYDLEVLSSNISKLEFLLIPSQQYYRDKEWVLDTLVDKRLVLITNGTLYRIYNYYRPDGELVTHENNPASTIKNWNEITKLPEGNGERSDYVQAKLAFGNAMIHGGKWNFSGYDQLKIMLKSDEQSKAKIALLDSEGRRCETFIRVESSWQEYTLFLEKCSSWDITSVIILRIENQEEYDRVFSVGDIKLKSKEPLSQAKNYFFPVFYDGIYLLDVNFIKSTKDLVIQLDGNTVLSKKNPEKNDILTSEIFLSSGNHTLTIHGLSLNEHTFVTLEREEKRDPPERYNEVTYVSPNPYSYYLSIASNKPTMLYQTDSYNSGWQLYYGHVDWLSALWTPYLSEKNHYVANGFANSYLINEDFSKLTLFYFPQSLFYMGLTISLIALAIICIILVRNIKLRNIKVILTRNSLLSIMLIGLMGSFPFFMSAVDIYNIYIGFEHFSPVVLFSTWHPGNLGFYTGPAIPQSLFFYGLANLLPYGIAFKVYQSLLIFLGGASMYYLIRIMVTPKHIPRIIGASFYMYSIYGMFMGETADTFVLAWSFFPFIIGLIFERSDSLSWTTKGMLLSVIIFVIAGINQVFFVYLGFVIFFIIIALFVYEKSLLKPLFKTLVIFLASSIALMSFKTIPFLFTISGITARTAQLLTLEPISWYNSFSSFSEIVRLMGSISFYSFSAENVLSHPEFEIFQTNQNVIFLTYLPSIFAVLGLLFYRLQGKRIFLIMVILMALIFGMGGHPSSPVSGIYDFLYERASFFAIFKDNYKAVLFLSLAYSILIGALSERMYNWSHRMKKIEKITGLSILVTISISIAVPSFQYWGGSFFNYQSFTIPSYWIDFGNRFSNFGDDGRVLLFPPMLFPSYSFTPNPGIHPAHYQGLTNGKAIALEAGVASQNFETISSAYFTVGNSDDIFIAKLQAMGARYVLVQYDTNWHRQDAFDISPEDSEFILKRMQFEHLGTYGPLQLYEVPSEISISRIYVT